jgi:poly-beta-1,6-N-acetyl-D-glucosamine N-deacetylase
MSMRILLLLLLLLVATPVLAANHAVIIMYHRFGEDQYPATNIGLEQFQQHLEILRRGGFSVWPVEKILAALESGQALPDKTVGITIDDAAISVYTQAWPRLQKYQFPFTIFVTTDDVDRNSKAYMNWAQLRELAASPLVTIGNHSQSHPSFAKITPLAIAQQLSAAQSRFQAELGLTPALFAYPYGEYSIAAQAAVMKFGFKTAFGQHSGVVHATADKFSLPRFAMNEDYGNADRFRQAVSALPLKILDLTPADSRQSQSPAQIHFALDSADTIKNLNCFLSEIGKVPVTVSADKITLTLPQPWGNGRQRVNCTAPATDGRYYWWGTQYIIARPQE